MTRNETVPSQSAYPLLKILNQQRNRRCVHSQGTIMSKSSKRGHHKMINQNRLDYKVINDDVVVFRRHDRLYRLSNLANNWIPGKYFVLINANTTAGDFEAVDRINILSPRSRKSCGKLFAELWQSDNAQAIQDDLKIILEVLTELGLTQVVSSDNPADAPRQFGKPWSAKSRVSSPKLAQV